VGEGFLASGDAHVGVQREHRAGRDVSRERRVARDVPRGQVSEIQRSRLIAAAVRAVEDLGYADTTVAQITSRARVSRRTFYELFANREECLAEVLEDAVGLIEGELAVAGFEGLVWRERVRLGLWVILSFFDREPVLARVCIVQALQGGGAVLGRREEILVRLVRVVDGGRFESTRARDLTPLTAEGVVGGVLAILYARVVKREQASLRALLGELMGMILLPYVGSAAARRELVRPAPAPVTGAQWRSVRSSRGESDPLDGVRMRLTYRTARVLEGVGEYPGASNREVATYAGISDQGQVSKLLARLKGLGLLVNRCEGHLKGEPNAWELTARGKLVTQGISAHLPVSSRAS
jgi:AcrR family transcriptional regulator